LPPARISLHRRLPLKNPGGAMPGGAGWRGAGCISGGPTTPGWHSGALGGWYQLRARLIGEGGRPGIYVFSTCADTIRTLPALQHDAGRPEDVDSQAEDHAADEVRYACMSRPWLPRRVAPKRPERLVYEAQPDGRAA
jgi:hypothetical protein